MPTVPVKLLVKDLPSLFESKDVKARDKVKEIVVRWANQHKGWLASRSARARYGADARGAGRRLQRRRSRACGMPWPGCVQQQLCTE